MKTSSPINTAMHSQLVIMEHFIHDMLGNVREAQERLDAGERGRCSRRTPRLRRSLRASTHFL